MIKCRLSRLLGDRKMSVLELKRRAELSYVTLTNLYHERTTGITFDTIDKVCKSLECNIGDLLEYVRETEKIYNILKTLLSCNLTTIML